MREEARTPDDAQPLSGGRLLGEGHVLKLGPWPSEASDAVVKLGLLV